jgi:predicted lipid-binding transport protein (Tim44 family)
MPRRPDLARAMLLAGLFCLGVFLSNRGWCREDMGAPVRYEEAGPAPLRLSSLSYQLAAHQAPPGNKPRPEGSAAPNSFCFPLNLNSFTGGFLGSLLCHYVYGYPLRYVWEEGLWPPGLLDILVLAALAYLGYTLYRRLKRCDQATAVEMPPSFLRANHQTSPPLSVREEARPGLAAIQELDRDFDVEAFGGEVHQLLQQLYAAWNHETVKGLNGRVKESLLEYLQMGLKIMSLREERSYLEDIILESIAVTDARVEGGKELITVCFRGRLLDYVLDKASGKLLLGSMAYPATFQEYWDLERPRGQSTWVVQDIRDG